MGWGRFFRRRFWDEERARELESYLAEEIHDNLSRGMTREAARAAAFRKLGNPTRIREEIYEMNSLGFLETCWQDLRYGARLLRRNPTFAMVAILTLALGTGANTAIFQLVDAVRLRALPVPDPQNLLELSVDTHGMGRTGNFLGQRSLMTEPLLRAIAERQQAFSSMLAWGSATFDLSNGGESQPARGMWVNGDFFPTLGISAQAGRLFGPSDDEKNCGAAGAVISDAFWHLQFAADPSAIGRPLSINGRTFTVLGVAGPSFFGVEVGKSFDIALPLCTEPMFRGEHTGIGHADVWFLDIIGRLKPGWTVDKANAHFAALSPGVFRSTLSPRLGAEDSRSYLAFTLLAKSARTGVSSLRGDYATPLWVLLGVTGGVLLIACANLANLMLARAAVREREVAVRLAIGASRRRILRQMLVEGLLIAALGAFVGLILAHWLGASLVSFLSTEDNPVFVNMPTDWRVFSFAAMLAVAACLLFGLAPAVRSTRTSLINIMKTTSRGMTERRERFGLRRMLIVVQVAVSLILVVGALLLVRTLQNLITLDAGFRHDGVLVADLDLRRADVPAPARTALSARIVERLQAIPGVEAAASTFMVPVSGMIWNGRVIFSGKVQPGNVNFNEVGAEYFKVLDTPLLAGRLFEGQDVPASEPVAIVNQSFGRKYFPGAPVLGQTFQIEVPQGEPQPTYRIVGLVKDTKYGDLREPFTPIVSFAASQDASSGPSIQVILRSRGSLTALSSAVTRAIGEINPAILLRYRTMGSVIRTSLVSERLMATLSGFFGGLAVLIAVIGLYGVISYMVARRRVEIGIRMALGADRRSVVRMIVGEATLLVIVGIVTGGVVAIACAAVAQSLLYGLRPWDPATLGLAACGLGAVSLIATWVPARRASRVAPTIALREE